MYIILKKIKPCITCFRKISSTFLCLVLVVIFNNSFCQTSPINWQPENEINFYSYPPLPNIAKGLGQDKYGYMWIGSSDGLYRFDGTTYKRFMHNDTDPNSIGANNCNALLSDSRGMLWISTTSGLSLLNTSTYKFRNFNYADTLFNDLVSGVFEDDKKNIWICSFGRKNLAKYEPANDKFTVYYIPDSLYIKGMRTFDLTINKDGKIYLAADYSVLIFNPETENYEKRIPSLFPENGNKLDYREAYCILSDKDGTIYTGNYNNPRGELSIGVYNRKLKCITYSYSDVDTKYATTNRIAQKSADELWIGSSGGLLIYNKKTKQCKPCRHKADDPFSFPEIQNSEINGIFKDQTGCFWFNAGNKIVKADPIDQNSKSYKVGELFGLNNKPEFNITTIMKCQNANKFLIGTWEGAGYYEVSLEKDELKKQKTFSNTDHERCEIQKIIIDAKGKLWSFTQHLVMHFDSVQGKFITCKLKTLLPSNPTGNFAFIAMIEDSRGHFWLGTTRHGVYNFNPADNSIVNYPIENYNSSYTKPDFMKPCFEDKQHNIWFVSFDGVYLYNLDDKNFTRISYKPRDIKYNDGRDLIKDQAGNIWRTSAEGGFQKFNTSTKMFEVISTNIDTRQIKLDDMIEDNRGYIWINSDEEILRFNPYNFTFLIPKQSMNIELGNRIVGYCNTNHTLYTSRDATLYEINTYNFNGNTNAPHIVFNNFKVLNNDTFFSKNLNELSSITLPFDKNFISIDFAALNFSHSENNQYSYKLDGIDKDWVMNGNKNSASYSKLAPGNYVFHVKASNNTGLWNDVGKSLTIVITPPWWKTWWACFLFAASVLLAGGYVLKIYTGRKMNLMRMELEKQHALQIERTRISLDLHDDIGSNLTSIALLSEVAKKSKDQFQVAKNLNLISTSAGELIDKMGEIIWAMNAKNDTLENLIAYIRAYASNYFEPYEIKFHIEVPSIIPHHVFNSLMRRTVFLVVKETLHNIAKHANATEVKAIVKVKEHLLNIEIFDNGKGFDADHINRFGNGLQNMNSRLSEIKSHYEIKSEPGKGTIIHLNITIPA